MAKINDQDIIRYQTFAASMSSDSIADLCGDAIDHDPVARETIQQLHDAVRLDDPVHPSAYIRGQISGFTVAQGHALRVADREVKTKPATLDLATETIRYTLGFAHDATSGRIGLHGVRLDGNIARFSVRCMSYDGGVALGCTIASALKTAGFDTGRIGDPVYAGAPHGWLFSMTVSVQRSA